MDCAQSRPMPVLASLNVLQRALKQVLKELECQGRNLSELHDDFKKSNITSTTIERLAKIDVPLNSTNTVPFYYLDFRGGVSANCASQSKPVIKRIESLFPIFPSHYAEWDCRQCAHTNRNVYYEVLQRTGSCKDGKEQWIGFENTIPLNVVTKCGHA